MIGKGYSIEEARKQIGMVIESVDNIDVAYKLLNSRKIYSLVSEYTYWREGDVIFVENNEGVMGKLYFDDELFSFGEIMGEWLVLI